jgi:hypothetical protein
MAQVTLQEWRWAALVALLVVAVSLIPYAIGFARSSPHHEFGGFVIASEDGQTYIAAMQQGAAGAWRFRLLYTPEEHPAIPIYLFYLALGHIAASLHLPLILVYHASRLLCGWLFLLTIYRFSAIFLSTVVLRRISFILTAFSSGLGWLLAIIGGSLALGGISPIDFWLMDAYTFFTLFLYPHFSLAISLLLGIFGGMLASFRSLSSAGSRGLWWPGWGVAMACALGVTIVNPYLLLVAAVVLGSYWLFLCWRRRFLPWKEALALASLAFPAVPLLAYYVSVTVGPVWTAFSSQDVALSPPLPYYIAGYGLVLLLALPGAYYAWRRPNEEARFLLVWVIVIALALYAPFKLQRRMITGLHVPLCILAALGLGRFILPAIYHSRLAHILEQRLAYPRKRLRVFTLSLSLAITSFSYLYLLASTGMAAAIGHPGLFYNAGEIQAMEWLQANTQVMDTVLSSYQIGNYIPARIGHRVLLGHWDETMDRPGKEGEVKAFFSAHISDEQRQAILRRYRVAYVFYGPREKALGDFDPGSVSYLERTFSADGVAIFRVVGL